MKLWTDCHVNCLASVLLFLWRELIIDDISHQFKKSTELKVTMVIVFLSQTHTVFVSVCNHANICVSHWLIEYSAWTVCVHLFCAVFELRIYGFHSILCYLNLIMSQYEHFYFFSLSSLCLSSKWDSIVRK